MQIYVFPVSAKVSCSQHFGSLHVDRTNNCRGVHGRSFPGRFARENQLFIYEYTALFESAGFDYREPWSTAAY